MTVYKQYETTETHGSNSLHERVTVIETDVKSLRLSVDALAVSIGKVAVQFEGLATEIKNFMVLWQNAVPIKLVLIMFGILCGCFFGSEIFKELLSYLRLANAAS